MPSNAPVPSNAPANKPRPLSLLISLALLAALVAAEAQASASVEFSTYLGGSNSVGADFASAVAVDGAGNVYVTGSTSASPDFPISAGVVQPIKPGGTDGFVAKFDAAGALVYSTFLGGSSNDNPLAIAVDASGAAYVVGTTTSSDFPVTASAVQPLFGGGSDAFVVKLSPDAGTLVYATYLGGSDTSEKASGVAVDAAGRAHVVGNTPSLDFPVTAGAFDTDCGLGGNCTTFNEDVFVAKLDAAGGALVYSTYVGGNKRDVGHHIALDAAGHAFVVGSTASSDFPTTAGAFDATAGGGLDGFLFELDPSGALLEYSTYLGGSASELMVGVAHRAPDELYLGGYTGSDDFPVTAGAFDTVCGSGSCSGSLDAFAMKIRTDGAPPVYSTFIGGAGLDFGFGVAVDDDGQLHLAGTTTSLDLPLQDPLQGVLTSGATCFLDGSGIENGSPCSDLFVSKLSADGSGLLFSDYVGGSDGETRLTVPGFNHNLALGGGGEIHVVGNTFSSDYPVSAAFQPALLGTNDAAVTKLGGIPGTDTTPPTAEAGPNQVIHAGDLVTLDGSGSFDDNTAGIDLLFQWTLTGAPAGSVASLSGAATPSPTFVADLPGTYLVSLVVTDEAGLASAPDSVEVSSLNVTPVADAGLDVIVVAGAAVDLDGGASTDVDGDPLTYSWSLDAAPAGSAAFLQGAGSQLATLDTDLVGTYLLSLVVNDGFVHSAADGLEVTAITAGELAEGSLLEACDYVSALPDGIFDAPGHRNVLCNFMAQAIGDLDKGKVSQAIAKIDDTLARTDGCPLRGAPDAKGQPDADWILGCSEQATLHGLLTEAREVLD